ncbi:Aspartate aminotransferase [hydrothermal vent metagenome]|uniref:Aspartate aminotransferase n=1 Tax=hydrothermal vent metagenome TaxID=652676 RepID=A0A3B1CLB2_9ZZZZ
MKFSKRIEAVKTSLTLEITALANELKAKGEDVIGFGAGEPDFNTPDNIKEAAIRAIRDNNTRYTPVGGTNALKDAVIHKFRQDNGLDYQRNQIVVSCGAKHSFFNLAQVLWDQGDEVLVPAPYWLSYPEMIILAGGQPVIVPTTQNTGFKITPELIESAVTGRTRAIIINSPSNPTGSAYTRKELEAIAQCALKHKLLIISDEIYEKIVFDGFEQVSIASLGKEVQENCVVINGMSKCFCMTGWRIGYLAAPAEIARQVTKLQSQSTSNPTSISQAASIEALTGPQDYISPMVAEFSKRRDVLVELLENIAGVGCYRPVGSFYTFPDFSAYYGKSYQGEKIAGSVDFARFLLKDAQVALVPGIAFGADNNVRLSFATSQEVIKKGMGRIAEAVAKLQ